MRSKPELPATFERRFKLWLYSVSLRRLCFRSLILDVPDATCSVEVMFQNVMAMQVRSSYRRLHLRGASEPEVAEIIDHLDETPHPDAQYVILGDHLHDGWVACSLLLTAENDFDARRTPELLAISGGIGVGLRGVQ